MQRRDFILSLLMATAGLPLSSANAIAATGMPYREVKVSGDYNRVIFFFDFNCPICRDVHYRIFNWGRSLPKSVQFEPLLVCPPTTEYMMALRAWYIVAKLSPEKIDQFADAVYTQVQDNGKRLDTADIWLTVVAKLGIPNQFFDEWKKFDTSLIRRAGGKYYGYDITATPALAIAGRYLITPDNTNGDMALFLQLANGLVSKTIDKKG